MATDRKSRRAAERAEAQFRESPIGQAVLALELDRGFFELRLNEPLSHWDEQRDRERGDETEVHSPTGVLAEIEGLGWALIHAAYVSNPGREDFSSIYLFQRARPGVRSLGRATALERLRPQREVD